MKTIAVLTSGGDAPGMNAAIRAIVRTAIYYKCRILGVKQGYTGLINGMLDDMELSSVADIIHRGGTILGTARSQEFETEEGQKKAMNIIDVYNIDGLIVLGGDGTFRGAKVLSDKGVPVIGIPCTIDNDLAYTELTIGFFTAVETAVSAIGKIRDTSSSHGRASIIEVMGRDCGDIGLYAGLAGGAESILVPEMPVDIDEICQKALQGRNRGKRHNLIVMAEGTGDPYEVAEAIKEKTDIDTRVTILGHIQRGGSPVAVDRIIASEMGKKAVELILEGQNHCLIGLKGHELFTTGIEEGLSAEKTFRKNMYESVKILSI